MNVVKKMKNSPPVGLFYFSVVLCWAAMVIAGVLTGGEGVGSSVIKLVGFVVVMEAVRCVAGFLTSIEVEELWDIDQGVFFLLILMAIAMCVLQGVAGANGISEILSEHPMFWELLLVFGMAPVMSYLYAYLNRYKKIEVEEVTFVTVSLMLINVIQEVLTKDLPLVYLIYMYLVNCVMLAAFLFNVCPRAGKKGNRFVIWLLYVAWCCVDIACKYDYVDGILGFLYNESGWYSYKKEVTFLFANVKKIGPAFEGIASIGESLLRGNLDPVHTLAYYYGLVPLFLYLLALLIVFAFITWMFVKSRKNINHHFLCVVAYVNLASRIILGLLLSFGVLSIRMGLPFRNILDWVSVGVLLAAHDTYSEDGKRGFFRSVLYGWFVNVLIKFLFIEDDYDDYDDDDEEGWEFSDGMGGHKDYERKI